jgi:hypothetical protein
VRTPIEEVDREMSALARTVSRRAPVNRSAAFVVVTVAWIALAGRLLSLGDTRTVWLQVGAVNLLSIGGYAFTRVFPTFIDRGDVGNWSEMLGLVALLVEGSLLLLSILQIVAGPPEPSARNRQRNPA